jgi:hypothetical protein
MLNALALQLSETRLRIDQIQEQLSEVNRQMDELRRAEARPADVDKLQASVDLARTGYVEALQVLRRWIDATRRQYAASENDAEVKAAIVTKNRGLARPQYKLGPSRRFLEIETKLKQHEEWVNPGATSGRRRAKAKTTPTPAGSLPPPF